jgi:hypothetical protein
MDGRKLETHAVYVLRELAKRIELPRIAGGKCG